MSMRDRHGLLIRLKPPLSFHCTLAPCASEPARRDPQTHYKPHRHSVPYSDQKRDEIEHEHTMLRFPASLNGTKHNASVPSTEPNTPNSAIARARESARARDKTGQPQWVAPEIPRPVGQRRVPDT